jgi:UDP-N-acetylmuramoyl-tripeptide--D-alanyl-D-alanine ligase
MYSHVTLEDFIQWTNALPQFITNSKTKVSGVSTDTRSLKSGDVFIALKGENFDGNKFLEEAEKKGAIAIIAEKPGSGKIPTLIVPDSLRALAAIGKSLRDKFKGTVVGITGSAGKSSTKECVATLLNENTVASPASFNNLMGVSRTLCLVTDATEFLVLEMGMNNFGEIEELCHHFRPQAGLITNIGDAHIGKLGGKEGIYKAKKEMFDFLAKPTNDTIGVALNVNDEYVVKAYESAFAKKPNTVSYSLDRRPATVQLTRREINPLTAKLSLDFEIGKNKFSCELPLFGLHHAQNIAASVAMATLLEIPFSQICERLPHVKPAYHRGEVYFLSENRVLVDESYNSNPSALISSLESFLTWNCFSI